ncbi:hypothetical protein, partial [Klebsiella pneumoniae]|uniref:hypothetical protein n=1 Tax=Klebsiella pneumoniae TaxID=573 RepID=UPI001D0F1267
YPAELRAHALSAEWNNTYITLGRLVLFLLFLLFDAFFIRCLLLFPYKGCDSPPEDRNLLFIATTSQDIITRNLH